jgi:hypothetical protein
MEAKVVVISGRMTSSEQLLAAEKPQWGMNV